MKEINQHLAENLGEILLKLTGEVVKGLQPYMENCASQV